MLSIQDNEILCQVGAGTPMGNLMRQYWMPALPSSELPSPDCPPVRLRLLGENLIAFRATSGKVGMVERLPAPRRLAVLRPQRRRGPALRLPRLEVRRRRRLRRHAVGAGREQLQEQGAASRPTRASSATASSGPTWARARRRRRCRTSRPNMVDGRARVSKSHARLQLDAGARGRHRHRATLAFLHGGASAAAEPAAGQPGLLRRQGPRAALRRPRDRVRHVLRRLPAGGRGRQIYWRIGHFLSLLHDDPDRRARRSAAHPRLGADGRRPHDGLEHQRATRAVRDPGRLLRQGGFGEGRSQEFTRRPEPLPAAAGGNEYLPDTTDWLGKFRLVANMENDYLIDREAQTNMGQLHRHQRRHERRLPRGPGDHREHGPDLRPHARSTSARPTR